MLAFCCAHNAQAESGDRVTGVDSRGVWRSIADSDLVVVGVISLPNEVPTEAPGGSDLHFTIKINQVLYGKSQQPDIAVQFDSGSPTTQELRSSKGLERVVFLQLLDMARYDTDQWKTITRKEWYLVNYDVGPATLEASTEVIENVKGIVARNEQSLHERFPQTDPKVDAQVQALIADMVKDPERERSAFSQLEALGIPAVLSTIRYMDDRRRLAEPVISLENKARNAFEARRFYGPKLVVDALAAILNQVTGMRFGDLDNGGSDAMRDHAVRGWRLYAHVVGQALVATPVFATDQGRVPKKEFVPDEETAIKIAEAAWTPIFGDSLKNERPFHAKLVGDVWYVEGSLPEGALGGVAEAEIAKADGKILRVSHGQ